ncbi:conserved membrane hypothetical protein [Novosphingobium sp. 9U]|nr:conserved membrane hypothetical protein [Novosphingobium sp. 9U]
MLAATWELLLRHPLGMVLGAVGMSALDSAVELLAGEDSISSLTSFVSIGVVYAIFRMLLKKKGFIDREGSFRSYFGVGLLSGIAIIVGFLFLVVPGLFLMARWSVASAFVITQGSKSIEALRASWQATRDCAWTIVLILVVTFGAYVAIFATFTIVAALAPVLLGGSVDAIDKSPPFVIMLNLLANIGTVGTAYLSVAIFEKVIGEGESLQGIFA